MICSHSLTLHTVSNSGFHRRVRPRECASLPQCVLIGLPAPLSLSHKLTLSTPSSLSLRHRFVLCVHVVLALLHPLCAVSGETVRRGPTLSAKSAPLLLGRSSRTPSARSCLPESGGMDHPGGEWVGLARGGYCRETDRRAAGRRHRRAGQGRRFNPIWCAMLRFSAVWDS